MIYVKLGNKSVNVFRFLIATFIQTKIKIMNNLLYTIAVILVVIWAIGFIGYNAGGLIHVLLVIAVISIIFNLIQGKKI